jgi:hypothetical protein
MQNKFGTYTDNPQVGRKLTYPTDKFRALDGTLNVIQQYLPGLENKAGLWVEDLHSGLAWKTEYSRATKYNEYIAPSWSWGNLDLSGSGMAYPAKKLSNGTPNHGMQQYLYDARLVDFCTPLAGIKSPSLDDPTTSVEDFALEISSECCSVCSCNIPGPFLDIGSAGFSEGFDYSLERVADPVNNFIERIGLEELLTQPCSEHTEKTHEEHLYIQLSRWEPKITRPNLSTGNRIQEPVIVALILKKKYETKAKKKHWWERAPEMPVYERIGRALIPTDPRFPVEWPTKTILLI